MQGFRGLLARQIVTDEAFVPIFRKAEQHQKAAQVCIDFFQQITKFFQSFSAVIDKSVVDSDLGNISSSYYRLIGFLCTRLQKQNKQLTENTKGSSKELTKICNTILQDFSKFLQGLQSHIRKYIESQQILQELSKKYFRSHKYMLSSIEAYKNSFTDVTLIYNSDEKLKRYQTCENNFKAVSIEYKTICEKCDALSERKVLICKNYEDLKEEFSKVIKMIGSKVIFQTKNFVSYYCATNKSITTFLAEQKYNLQRQILSPFFTNLEDPTKLEYFNLQKFPQSQGKHKIPLIFQYPQHVKQEFLETYNVEMLNYLKRVEENALKRRLQNQKISELFVQYFKNIEKVHIFGVKQIVSNFDKVKKKLTESFGPRLSSFVKSINAIFQLLSGIDEKLVKNVNPKILIIQTLVNQEAKLLKLFNDQLKSNIQKFIGKKELKRFKQEQFTQESSNVSSVNFRKEIVQKANFIKHLILGFHEKMSKNCQKISKAYTSIIQDMSESVNQFYSLCCEYQQMYFGPEQFQKNFKIYQNDVNSLIEKNKTFFDDLPWNGLKSDTSKIVFDGQFSKVQDFKKLKKPIVTENSNKKQNPKGEQKTAKQGEDPQSDAKQKFAVRKSESSDNIQVINSSPDLKNNRKSSAKEPFFTDQKQAKHCEFLLSKIQFKQGETLLKSFTCALSQKIVLQGRIYITNQRICFNSGFNSNNLFFGGTFIQFPKEHITKIQKRMNAVFMDNSISITTVKGQLFFTSFFSRNQAYDLICKTFGFSLDEHVYEFQQPKQQQLNQMIVQIKQFDDMQDQDLVERSNKINELLTSFNYSESANYQITKQGLNAYQIFKIFYANNEITINRRKYSNFLTYIKQLYSHKQVVIEEWNVPLAQIMNQSNIKKSFPPKIFRKVFATVPVANSGVPFMPKTAKSEETQNLYFFSKQKFMIEAEITTSGVPYSDTFKVQLRTIVQSDQSGKCEIKMKYYINFVKNTMMKAVIESKSQEETVRAAKIWVDEIKNYFSAIAKAENSLKKGAVNQTQNFKEQLETKNIQIQSLSKQKEELKKQIESLKLQNQKHHKIIVGLVALSVILLLLLIL